MLLLGYLGSKANVKKTFFQARALWPSMESPLHCILKWTKANAKKPH